MPRKTALWQCLYEHVLASRVRRAWPSWRALSSDLRLPDRLGCAAPRARGQRNWRAVTSATLCVRAARCRPGDARPRRDRALPVAFPERLRQVPGSPGMFPITFLDKSPSAEILRETEGGCGAGGYSGPLGIDGIFYVIWPMESQ